MGHHHSSQHILVVVVVLLLALAAAIHGRELRPSDHGLAYQEDSPPPTQNDDAQEMQSFFGTTTTSSSSSSSSVQLPEAKNISDTWRNAHVDSGGGSRDGGRDQVKLGLLVASAVCGLTGIVLLVVSAVVFLFRIQKQKLKAERIPAEGEPAFVAHAARETL